MKAWIQAAGQPAENHIKTGDKQNTLPAKSYFNTFKNPQARNIMKKLKQINHNLLGKKKE